MTNLIATGLGVEGEPRTRTAPLREHRAAMTLDDAP